MSISRAFAPGLVLAVLSGIAGLQGALVRPAFGQAGSSGDPGHGRALFVERCALCHAASGRENGQGPSLAGIVGRRAGATDFGYTRALREAGFTWDAGRLDRYLQNPGAAVPGTSMQVEVADGADRRDLVGYLGTLPAPAAEGAGASAPSPDPAAAPGGTPLVGRAAFGDWRSDAPGVRRRITPADLPAPYATRSSGNAPRIVERPAGANLRAPPGFRIDLFAEGLDNPRLIRVAPNGDIFLSETAAGRIRVLRAADGETRAQTTGIYAAGLQGPFGIAFYPPGPDPRWLYVAETNRVVRYPYRAGDTVASGPPEIVVARLTGSSGGHSTRDLVFSADGARMFVSVGSQSNVAEGVGQRVPGDLAAWEAAHGLGALWGSEEGRAAVIAFTPQGGERRIYATGLRNCVGLALQPATRDLWCSTNERDGLGDDLVPDYVTRVREGAWYGWPWYFVGGTEEPRLKDARPDLRGRMTEPDVLLQPHSASLQMTFYTGTSFPAEYRGDAFAAEHGSWNRAKRTGYKVIRVRLRDGVPTGEYEDFLTGFVIDDRRVWGRPVGVATAHDGALLVSEDGNGTIWRVAPER